MTLRTRIVTAVEKLPLDVKKKLFNLVADAVPDYFTEYAYRYALAPNMLLGLQHLAGRGFNPSVVLDVGGYEGDFSRMVRGIWPSASIHIFEANPDKTELLAKCATDIDAQVHMSLLGASDDQTVSYFQMESGSSVLEENSPLSRNELLLETKTLDSLLGTVCDSLLKIDVQGYELEVLKGGEGVLAKCEAVLLEVALIEINKGAPLAHEVIAFMAERGFVVADVLEIHRRPLDRSTNQIDLLFLPKHSPLMADKRHF